MSLNDTVLAAPDTADTGALADRASALAFHVVLAANGLFLLSFLAVAWYAAR